MIALSFCVTGGHATAQQSQQAASQPALRGARPFQPGIRIDWPQRAVQVHGQVVLREGPVEFLACRPGKEHESIIRLDASATHIYMALGLVGIEPGHPPQWDEQRGRFGPPAGDLIDMKIEWDEDGRQRTAAGFEWLRELEYGRTPIDRPWIFAGSHRLRDGMLSADRSGAAFAVVDMPDSLLALSRNHISRDAELWALANTAAIPALRTPVRIVLRPARPRTHEIRIDFRGVAFVDGRYASRADLADLIKLARRLSPDYVPVIRLEGTLRSDAARWRRVFVAAGVPVEALRFIQGDPPTATRGSPAP